MAKSKSTKKNYSNWGLSDSENEELQKYCKQNDIKVSQLIRKLLREHVLNSKPN